MHYPKLELLEKYKDEAEICKEIEQQKHMLKSTMEAKRNVR